jgi:hypothetical protein
MLKHISLFLVLILIDSFIALSNTKKQNQPRGYAKIRYIDNETVHSKTYLGKLTKGKIENLKYELNNNLSEFSSKTDEKNRSEPNGSMAFKTNTNLTKKRKNATIDLLGNYEIKDEKSLKRVREKKMKVNEKTSGRNIQPKNNKNIEETSNRPSKNISKKFRIGGKRICNGQTFRKHAGTICLIVKYKIREGNYVNTYVSIVEDYLKEDSKYNLRYHGSGSKRKYYLEYAPLTIR